ncbi:MAG: hypothetical protein HY319_06245 [Armatimonadetes bacterium]|nr:hypothetical protein [Armatimonadota bacterium]
MIRHVLAMAVFLSLGAAAGAQEQGPVPDSVRKAFREASPTQRLSARRMVMSGYPDLRQGLREHLQARYPDLEIGAARAVVSLGEKHPGLVFSLPRHLIGELGGEPVQAFLDVSSAVTERYPNFPKRFAALRRQYAPRAAAIELAVQKYPGVGEDLLRTVREVQPGLRNSLAIEARTVIRDRYPTLPSDVALEALGALRESDPQLPARLLAAARGGERPLRWLIENEPGVLRTAMGRVHRQHGTTLRQAAVDVLQRLEETHGKAPAQVAGALLSTIEKRYPDLPREVRTTRVEAGEKFRQALLAEFPELPDIAARTLESKHPDLARKVADAVDRHYPGLRGEFWTALEAEHPGIRQEIRTYVSGRYPDLFQKLEATLRG